MKSNKVPRKPIKCHHCHTKTVEEISYGNPTKHVMQQANEGKSVLRSCIIKNHIPQ